MKAVIEINKKQGCLDCPYCYYDDSFEDIYDPRFGFYCKKTKEMISSFYNTRDGNGLIIPKWCPLTFID